MACIPESVQQMIDQSGTCEGSSSQSSVARVKGVLLCISVAAVQSSKWHIFPSWKCRDKLSCVHCKFWKCPKKLIKALSLSQVFPSWVFPRSLTKILCVKFMVCMLILKVKRWSRFSISFTGREIFHFQNSFLVKNYLHMLSGLN